MSGETEQANPGRDITIMVPGNKFGELIAGLLGKPQITERALTGPFSITRDDIISLHSLIDKRIHDQAKAALIQTQIKLIYHDGLSVELNSMNEFARYAEVRPSTTKGIELTWVYLVEFPGRSTPERQQIEIIFSRPLNIREHFELAHVRSHPTRRPSYYEEERTPSTMRVRITHTVRSWGSDMEALLYSHLHIFQQEEAGIPRLLKKFSTYLGFASAFGLFSLILFIGKIVLAYMLTRYVVDHSLPGKGTSLASLNDRLDVLVRLLAVGTSSTLAIAIAFYVIIGIVLAAGLGTFVGSQAGEERPSTILITQRDATMKDVLLRAYRNNWKTVLASSLGSIAIGLITSTIFVVFM